MTRPLIIAVIGEGNPAPEVAAAAEAVGEAVAAAGAVLVCGGLGGVMEAACRGAARRGGISIGLLPGLHHADANPHVTYAVPTGLGYARNILVVRSAHAVIAVGGRFGTLSEIAFAKVEGIPVVGSPGTRPASRTRCSVPRTPRRRWRWQSPRPETARRPRAGRAISALYQRGGR